MNDSYMLATRHISTATAQELDCFLARQEELTNEQREHFEDRVCSISHDMASLKEIGLGRKQRLDMLADQRIEALALHLTLNAD